MDIYDTCLRNINDDQLMIDYMFGKFHKKEMLEVGMNSIQLNNFVQNKVLVIRLLKNMLQMRHLYEYTMLNMHDKVYDDLKDFF